MPSSHPSSSSPKSAEQIETAKKRGGRPAKDPSEVQTRRVMVSFSHARYDQLQSHARKGGQTVAGVIKLWMKGGVGIALTAEQHACVRSLPGILNELKKVADLLAQQPERQDQATDLLNLREQLQELLISFQQ